MRDMSSSAGQFRPVSWADFLRYAKALAWMIEEPLQRSQELLARIYGYSDRHEIQAVLDKPGTAGPFDYDRITRNDQLLDLVAHCKNLDGLQGLRPRWFDVREIGLFAPPALHRTMFLRVRTKVEILEARAGSEPSARSAYEYATVGTTIACEDEYVLHFTQLGQAVYDAVRDVVDRSIWLSDSERYHPATVEQKLNEITAQHPNNPWSRAAKVDFFADIVDLEEDAHLLLDDATHSISLFTNLFDGHERQAADHKLFTPNAETYLWPAVLYWGGVLALECGKRSLARRWLTINKKVACNDGFGAGRVLKEIRSMRPGG